MTPEEYQWYINLVRDRHQYLNLTYEQAEKVYKYEQDKDTYSDKHYFSAWEEWDYELTTFREILTGEQLKNYEASLQANIQHFEQSLIEQDNEKTNEVAYNEELLRFYETHLLPELFEDHFLRFGWLLSDKAKVEYLRNEHKHFLNDTKKEILTNHFRHNRTLKPNELKASLLRYKLLSAFPDYTSFKYKMDEPTRSVAQYLEQKLQYLPEETENLLTRKFQELKEFNNANLKKHYGDIRGWHVIAGRSSPEEERKHRNMTLLLLNKDKYGC
jgi:hypothetical protein